MYIYIYIKTEISQKSEQSCGLTELDAFSCTLNHLRRKNLYNVTTKIY